MASPQMALPPGAKLVPESNLQLPPGAKLVSDAPTESPASPDGVPWSAAHSGLLMPPDDALFSAPVIKYPWWDIIHGGSDKVAEGVLQASDPGVLPKVGGASKILRGMGEMALPMLPVGLMTAPLATLAGLGVGSAGSGAVGLVGNAAGLPPEVTSLAQDLAGIATGGMTAKAASKIAQFQELSPELQRAVINLLPRGRQLNALRSVLFNGADEPKVFPAPPVRFPGAPDAPKAYPAPRVTFPAQPATETPKAFPAPPVRFPATEAPTPDRAYPAPPVRFSPALTEEAPRTFSAPPVTFRQAQPPLTATPGNVSLDELATSLAGKPYGKLTSDQQAAVRTMADRVNAKPNVAVPLPPTPEPTPEGGKLYSKTKNPHTELTSQIHAMGREMDLPGSPVGKGIHVTPVANEVFGKPWNDLSLEQKGSVVEFLHNHKRMPTKADVQGGLLK